MSRCSLRILYKNVDAASATNREDKEGAAELGGRKQRDAFLYSSVGANPQPSRPGWKPSIYELYRWAGVRREKAAPDKEGVTDLQRIACSCALSDAGQENDTHIPKRLAGRSAERPGHSGALP